MSTCYAKVIGGLGNQLFIVATGYAYAKRHGMEFRIDDARWVGHQGKHPTTYKDTIFRNFKFDHVVTRDVIPVTHMGSDYLELPQPLGSVSLNGYFQSLLYFEECVDEFLDLLWLPDVDTEPLDVAMHVRRGDYLKFRDIHFVCDTNYFQRQFERFEDQKITMFTDSPDLVSQEFSDVDFALDPSTSELESLAFMSKHDIIVGSNSSFSWWASLIGNPKTTVVPDRWFADRVCEDIYRTEMEQVKS